MTDGVEPSTSSPSPSSVSCEPFFLHPRREPFEHGLLPIPKLIFSDPTQSLFALRNKLLSLSDPIHISPSDLSEALQISADQSTLVLDTLASVIHSDSDPPDADSATANVYDLIQFLYIQSYKRLLPRTHKDSAAVADVWPSTSAFDGYLSALSPLQLVRCNSRRFMPSQADEEAHQLTYLQKHMANIVSLLADSVNEEEESSVLTMKRFDSLGFLITFCEKGSEVVSLSQVAPFFANSDPEMPAVPVSATQAGDWIIQNIVASLEHISERVSAKSNAPSGAPEQDVAMTDVCTNSIRASSSCRSPSFIEGISKTSFVKRASDFKGTSVKVLNCHESVLYILAPLKYAAIYGCSDMTIVLGAVGKALRVEHCERVHVITAAKRICIANCRECLFFLGVNRRPLIIGDNHKLQVAPFNTYYSQLEEHMGEAGIVGSINRWDEPLALGLVDPHDSISHPAGVSDVQAESATRLDPDQFTNFLIPSWFGGESEDATQKNPFTLPESYMVFQQRKKNLEEINRILKEAPLEESRKQDLSSAIHMYFRDWLYASGNIRQLYCLQGE